MTLDEARSEVLVAARKLGALLEAHDNSYSVPGSYDETVSAEACVKLASREYFKAALQAQSTHESLKAEVSSLKGDVDRLSRELVAATSAKSAAETALLTRVAQGECR